MDDGLKTWLGEGSQSMRTCAPNPCSRDQREYPLNPSTCLIKPPTFKEFFSARSPPEDYFPLGWISYGDTPPHLKICRQASCFACGDARLQHLRDLQPIVFNRESIQGHGPTIAEPRIPYCGGEGGGPPIKQELGLIKEHGSLCSVSYSWDSLPTVLWLIPTN